MLRRCFLVRSFKNPGTPGRAGGFDDAEEMLHPKATMSKKNAQRAGMRLSKRVAVLTAAFITVVVLLPTHAGPVYVTIAAGQEWLRKAENQAKSIWTRRNERDHYLYMTQRKNTLIELLGLKRYNISGDDNDSDEITKYK